MDKSNRTDAGLLGSLGKAVIVHSSTQNPSAVRTQLAEIFGLPQSQVRVLVPFVGGGYGQSHLRPDALRGACTQGAAAGPMGAVARRGIFNCSLSCVSCEIEDRVKRDGTLVAREVQAVYDTGAYAITGPSTSRNGGEVSGGPDPIRIRSLRAIAFTPILRRRDRTAALAYRRSAGPTNRKWTTSRAGSEFDPVELRLKNIVHEGDVCHRRYIDFGRGIVLPREGSESDRLARQGRAIGKHSAGDTR